MSPPSLGPSFRVQTLAAADSTILPANRNGNPFRGHPSSVTSSMALSRSSKRGRCRLCASLRSSAWVIAEVHPEAQLWSPM